jgi:hypothetical protein
MQFECMSATLDLPIKLERLSPEEITWLAAKSNQTGKPVNEVARDLISAAAAAQGFGPSPSPSLDA